MSRKRPSRFLSGQSWAFDYRERVVCGPLLLPPEDVDWHEGLIDATELSFTDSPGLFDSLPKLPLDEDKDDDTKYVGEAKCHEA